MNKQEFIAEVAKKAGLTKVDATRAVDAFVEVVEEALREGDEIRITNFGTFAVSERAATTGHNPRTGEKIEISATKQPKFRAGKGLKVAVNQ